METIIINGKKFEYELKRKSVRTIRLCLTSKNSFFVSCHYLTPKFLVNQFIRSHADWIIKNSVKILPKFSVFSLENLKILGVDYKIIKSKSIKDWVIIDRIEQKIYLNTKSDSENHLKVLFSKHLKILALKLIKDELHNLQKEFGFKFNRVSLKNQKTRFGSCSSLGNLNFNWQIIFFPYEQFRHILLHELTHLEIKNHSHRYWNQLTVYDPNCKANNRWLKDQGTKYLIF